MIATELAALDALKARLDALRPLPPAVMRALHDDLTLRWTYHSNAIDGNTLTLMETKLALEGVAVGGKPLREHFEVVNHRDAIRHVEAMVRHAERPTELQIRRLHSLVVRQIDDDNAGGYRNLNMAVVGARHPLPDHRQVPEQMAALCRWLDTQAAGLHPVERAARLHLDFVRIHPFALGNGRTARLLLNLALMKAGFPAIVLPVARRLTYYEVLDSALADGDAAPFHALVAEGVRASFTPYWQALGIAP